MVIALALFAAANSGIWNLTTPAHFGPDESEYMRTVEFIADNGRFPEFGVDKGFGVEARSVGGETYPYRSYADRPGFPFVLSALVMAMPTDNEWMDFRQARLPSALYAALLVMFGFLATRKMFPGRDRVAVLVAASLAFWPQVSSMMSVVNDDGFTAMACAGLVWTWYRGVHLHWSKHSVMLAGAFAGLAMLGKPSGFLLAAVTFVVIALTHPGDRRAIGRAILLTFAVMLVVCGWRYAIAINMYGLDVFNAELTRSLSEAVGGATHPARDYVTLQQLLSNTSIITPIGDGALWTRTARTFVTSMTYNDFKLSAPWLAGFGAFALVAVWARATRPLDLASLRRSPRGRLHLVVAALTLVYMVGLIWRVYVVDAVMGGQYLFPALLPILAMMVWSVDDLARRGGALARWALFVYPAFLLCANLWSLKMLARLVEQPLTSWFGSWQFLVVLGWAGVVVVTALLLLNYSLQVLWPMGSTDVTPSDAERLQTAHRERRLALAMGFAALLISLGSSDSPRDLSWTRSPTGASVPVARSTSVVYGTKGPGTAEYSDFLEFQREGAETGGLSAARSSRELIQWAGDRHAMVFATQSLSPFDVGWVGTERLSIGASDFLTDVPISIKDAYLTLQDDDGVGTRIDKSGIHLNGQTVLKLGTASTRGALPACTTPSHAGKLVALGTQLMFCTGPDGWRELVMAPPAQ